MASTAEAAIRERVGTQLRTIAGRESVTAGALATPDGPVVVTAITVTGPRCANLPVKAAGRWVNRSLAVGTGIYVITQAWAAAFRRAGFSGICYEPRFTLGRAVRAAALFGAAGAPHPLPSVGTSKAAEDVLTAAGVRVAHPPASAPPLLPTATPPPLL